MNEAIYYKLVEVARAEGLISYGEVADLAGLDMGNPADRTEISWLLDEINKHEAQYERPMLSAVVVRADTQMPGQGFFVCARDIGRLPASDSIEELAFWAKEVKVVHSYWVLHTSNSALT
jgi:hypothetical protein